MKNPSEHSTGPEDTVKVELIPEMPPSGGYEDILTAMYRFSRYLFA